MKSFLCFIMTFLFWGITLYIFDTILHESCAVQSTHTSGSKDEHVLKAGFSRVKVTPPLGTFMTGFGNRDRDHGCEGIHDDLLANALYLTQGKEEVLIMGFDLLFFSRDEADRYKGAIGRALNLSPKQILLNTSHTHTGPKVGTWYYTLSDTHYLNWLEQAIVKAACDARDSAREATLWAGSTRTALPMNRRMRDENGKINLRPNPDGIVYNSLPIILLKDTEGKPVSLLFSVACHPSTIKGDVRAYQISADYPGTAMQKVDTFLGAGVSLFLQGAGGDSKASVIGKGQKEWRSGTWDDVAEAGTMVGNEVVQAVTAGLTRIEPEIRNHIININLSLSPPMTHAEYEAIAKDPNKEETLRQWAQEQVTLLDRGYKLATSVPVSVHGIQLGKGLRIIGIEGEIVAEIGLLIKNHYTDGITFALGYSDGAQLYIPTSKMLGEGGYEVESYWEYRQPAPLAKSIEEKIIQSLNQLKDCGIK